jgi:hypothetical protein
MDWIIRFIDHLYTPLGTADNYRFIIDLHKSLHSSSPVCSVISLFLVMHVNGIDSSASRAQVLPSRFQFRTVCWLSVELVAPIFFFITPWHQLGRQHPVATGTCLLSCCIAVDVVSFVSRSLPSSGFVRHSRKLFSACLLSKGGLTRKREIWCGIGHKVYTYCFMSFGYSTG